MLAVEQNIGTIVIGHNDGWKQSLGIGRRNNQSFHHIPHHMLIKMIEYKAAEQGIIVILTEEAYTSKASFLDQDPLPSYGEEGTWIFSGKRMYRGLYQEHEGLDSCRCQRCSQYYAKSIPKRIRQRMRMG